MNILFIILAGVSWGTAGLFVNQLLGFGFDSVEMACVRCVVGGVSAFIYTYFTDKESLKIKLNQVAILIVSGIAFFLMAFLYYLAIKHSSASTAVILLYLAPIVVMTFSIFYFKEKFTITKLLAAICSLIGCGLVTGLIGGLRFELIGIVYALLSCLCYATYSICVKLALTKGAKTGGITAYSFVFAALISFIFLDVPVMYTKLSHTPIYGIINFILFGFVTGFLASFFYSKAMEKLPAGVVSSMASIEPMTQTILCVIFLNEILTVSSVIGILLILAAVIILSFCKK